MELTVLAETDMKLVIVKHGGRSDRSAILGGARVKAVR